MTLKTLIRQDLLSLSISERIQLVQDLWDSIVEVPEQLPLTDEQKTELDQRMQNYQKNPEAGTAWQIVKDRLKSKK
jgi:putative addiction module component (TIGR02574 family)